MTDLTIQDRVKRLYQRHFGGGHLIADPEASLRFLQEECAALSPARPGEPLFEPLGGGLCRMHLRPLMQTGLSLQTAFALFAWTAAHTAGDPRAFEADLDRMDATEDERAWLHAYRRRGCPAVRHSDAYRAAYAPAYRVVSSLFADAFELIARMDRLKEGIVAIDGPCASAKSTLGAALGEVFRACVVPLDDFFLQPFQRTKERLAEPGGNFDRERFLSEALLPLANGRDFSYRPYNCADQVLGEPVTVRATPLCIVEGVYCQHPLLRSYYDLKAALRVDPKEQAKRLLRRNGPDMLKRFEAEWIPMENAYFEAFSIFETADVVLTIR